MGARCPNTSHMSGNNMHCAVFCLAIALSAGPSFASSDNLHATVRVQRAPDLRVPEANELSFEKDTRTAEAHALAKNNKKALNKGTALLETHALAKNKKSAPASNPNPSWVDNDTANLLETDWGSAGRRTLGGFGLRRWRRPEDIRRRSRTGATLTCDGSPCPT